MGIHDRFELALERLQPEDWSFFEKLCSQFLVSEFPDLRTTATTSGDGGRDSELFEIDHEPTVVFQYSVAKDWQSKIKHTIKRLKDTKSSTRLLIYLTNHIIGANADKLKAEARKKNDIILDIRDKSWFLDRCTTDENRIIAANKLCSLKVDPLLSEKGIGQITGNVFDNDELQAVHLILALQYADEQQDKGLTKIAYEAIIKTILRDTNSTKTHGKQYILQQAFNLLPSHPKQMVEDRINSALLRMSKHAIRHIPDNDTYHLTQDEIQRISTNIAKYEHNNDKLKQEIRESLTGALTCGDDKYIDEAINITVTIIHNYLSTRGEKFACSVAKGEIPSLAYKDLKQIIHRHSGNEVPAIKLKDYGIIFNIICNLLEAPSDSSQSLFRMTFDSYTLMAFLKETTDIQKCVKKIFSFAEIWLDTNIILPLIAELLIDLEERRQYSTVFNLASAAGVKFNVIPGVIEEINGHFYKCLACVRHSGSGWVGEVPFLLSLYISSGRDPNAFHSWLENFKGDHHPLDDISDYLNRFFSIETKPLESELVNVSKELRYAIQEVWRESHTRRNNQRNDVFDNNVLGQLIRHDEENYVGVLGRRSRETRRDVGYTTWWLTLDSTAYRMQDEIKKWTNLGIEYSPIMSLDFLSNNVSFGPLRSKHIAGSRSLPIFLDMKIAACAPVELINIAIRERENSAGLAEHVIQRRVRDRLDTERKRLGPQALEGYKRLHQTLEEEIEASFEDLPPSSPSK